jgi:hypothetical protein
MRLSRKPGFPCGEVMDKMILALFNYFGAAAPEVRDSKLNIMILAETF